MVLLYVFEIARERKQGRKDNWREKDEIRSSSLYVAKSEQLIWLISNSPIRYHS